MCRVRSSGLTCKLPCLPQLWWCESLARASPAGGDNSGHNYYCWAHCQPSWTQWRGESAALFIQFCLLLMGVLSVKAEAGPPSALHSLILPELLGLHLIPSTPRISSLYPHHPLRCECFAMESWARWHPHGRGVWWQFFGSVSPWWGGSMDTRACNA